MTVTPATRRAGGPAATSAGNARGGWLLAAPLLLFTACMFLYPAITMLRTSLAESDDVDAGGFTFSHYISFFADELYVKALTNTLLIALLTAVITGAIGLVYAYQLTVRPGLRQLQLALLLTPLLVNGVVRIFGLQLGLISVDNLLMRANVIGSPIGLNYSFAGIVIALAMFQFPFMAMAVYASLSRLDISLLEAARTLGAGRLSVLVRVVFPLAVPGMVAGGVLTFAAAAGTFIVPAMMGGGRVNTVPQMIYTSVSQSQLWATASAFAVILVVVLVIPIMLGTRFGRPDTSGTR
nr:ABC transporter permease [Dactylosporangium thailandense]